MGSLPTLPIHSKRSNHTRTPLLSRWRRHGKYKHARDPATCPSPNMQHSLAWTDVALCVTMDPAEHPLAGVGGRNCGSRASTVQSRLRGQQTQPVYKQASRQPRPPLGNRVKQRHENLAMWVCTTPTSDDSDTHCDGRHTTGRTRVTYSCPVPPATGGAPPSGPTPTDESATPLSLRTCYKTSAPRLTGDPQPRPCWTGCT